MSNTTPQEKAQKLINLGRSGTAGERRVAMTKLNSLLHANGMTVDDLDPPAEPETCNAFGYMFNSLRNRIKGPIQ